MIDTLLRFVLLALYVTTCSSPFEGPVPDVPTNYSNYSIPRLPQLSDQDPAPSPYWPPATDH